MKNKTLIIVIITILIVLTIISIFAYKFLKKGNTINKSEEDIIENILNINSYKATLEIEVETNKNKNKYVVKQVLENGTLSRQEIIEPSNITGVVTEYDGKDLKIINNNLNLTTTFENYSYIVDNNLWLNSFVNDYKKYANSKVTQKDNQIILELKNEEANKYNIYKKLYIDKNTRKTN